MPKGLYQLDNIRIIIIDDHQVLIDGLKALLTEESASVVGCATTFSDGASIIGIEGYDIALIDINIGGEDGLELIELVKAKGKKAIILTSFTDIRLIKKALNNGADGYITKESTTEYIIEAIDTVINEGHYFDPIIQSKLNKSFIKSPNNHKENERSIEAHLTRREKEVLILIAQEMTSEEIAQKLYVARSTVDTYRKSLIEKLKVKNAVGLGIWATKNGLI